MKKYDLIVIGGGPGGYVSAIKASQLGLKTLIIEKGDLGGVCLNWGCIPTKTLLKTAKVYENILNAKSYGIDIDNKNISINWKNIQKRKDRVIRKLRGGIKLLLKGNNVEMLKGEAIIKDKNTIIVEETEYITKNIIIATGSSTYFPEIDGIIKSVEEGFALTSKTLLELKELPKSLVILGGGVIAVEFACLFSTLEVDVTIIQRSSRLLRHEDKDAVDILEKELKKRGVKIEYDTSLKKVYGGEVIYEKDGETKNIKCDKVLVSLGRVSNNQIAKNLNLELSKSAIKTDEYLNTSIKGVYAIGDVNGKALLAHVASFEGIVAARNIGGENIKMDYNIIPNCIYTFPQIASVGLLEGKESVFPVSANGKSLGEGEELGFIKLFSDEKTNKINGCVIISSGATELISGVATSIRNGLTAEDIINTIHPHPTTSEIIMEAAVALVDKPIHILE